MTGEAVQRTEPQTPVRRPLPAATAVISMFAVAAVAFTLINARVREPATAHQLVLATVPLFDNADAPVFQLGAMAPEVPISRCIQIGYSGGVTAGIVRLAATDVTGSLADNLAVAIERGDPGTPAGCPGFTGSTIFEGSLRSLARLGDHGVPTGWQPVTAETRGFRITVTVTAAQPQLAASATATFVWRLQQAAAPAQAAASRPAATSTAPSLPASRLGAVPNSPAPATAAGGHGLWSKLFSAAASVARAAKLLADESRRHAGIPAGLVVVFIGFLVFQNRLDRSDPKLALAPVWRSRYLRFAAETDEP
jgi:hypothetical protein